MERNNLRGKTTLAVLLSDYRIVSEPIRAFLRKIKELFRQKIILVLAIISISFLRNKSGLKGNLLSLGYAMIPSSSGCNGENRLPQLTGALIALSIVRA